jgi:hypothetical protein
VAASLPGQIAQTKEDVENCVLVDRHGVYCAVPSPWHVADSTATGETATFQELYLECKSQSCINIYFDVRVTARSLETQAIGRRDRGRVKRGKSR